MSEAKSIGVHGGLTASERKAKEREYYRSNGYELTQVWLEPNNVKLLNGVRGRDWEKKPKNEVLDNRVLINTVLSLLDNKVLKGLAKESLESNKPIEKVIKEYVKREAEKRKFK